MTFTRTRTHYWGDDELGPLDEAIEGLAASYQDRRPAIDDEARDAMQHRITLLRMAAHVAREPAG